MCQDSTREKPESFPQPAAFVFATLAPSDKLHLLPVAAGWFVVARFAFLVGYHWAPTARAFGFGSTFYPTVVFLIYDAIAVLRSWCPSST